MGLSWGMAGFSGDWEGPPPPGCFLELRILKELKWLCFQ
jgi:hypothetical protein